MSESHTATCDKCGVTKKMWEDTGYGESTYELPSGWKNVKKNWYSDKDFCPKCLKLLKKVIEEFVE